jgi:hypothetical protein
MANPLNLAEILVPILNFLSADQALYPALFVNRFWYYTVGQILWKHIKFLDSLRQKKFLRICKNLKPFHKVNVRNLIFLFSYDKFSDEDINGIIGSYPNIVCLNFNATGRLAISDTAFINIVHSYPNLLRLELFECAYISDTAIKEIAKSCPRLEHLNLGVCGLISEDSICIIARSCRNLRYLDLMQCFISDRAIKEIAKSCHKLEHLDIYGCDGVTNLGIRDIARSCPKLKYLDLGNCEMIGNSAIREIARLYSNLKFLDLEFYKGISRNVLEKLDRNIKIEWPDSDSDNESNLSDSEW